MKKNAVRICKSFLLISLIAFSIDAFAQSEETKQLDELIEKTVKPNDPGVAVIVVKNGEIEYQQSRGIADLSTKKTITAKTSFYIASLSKQFTAVAIEMLEERGKLNYDDKLVKYFPEFSSFAPEITLRQILTHTSGLIDHLDVMEDKVTGWTNDDVVKLLKKESRVKFQPLDKFSYSNSGYVLLAMIVEKVSGMSFSEFLSKNIFKPLKMNNTYVVDRKNLKIPDKAKGYSLVDGKWEMSDYDAFTVGAGGIYSTLEDLEKWDRSFYTKPLVKKETIKTASVPPTLNNGKPTPYGFGWLAEYAGKGDLANVWYVASSGNFKGFQSFMKRIPERNFSVIVLSNYGNFPWEIVRLAEKLYANDEKESAAEDDVNYFKNWTGEWYQIVDGKTADKPRFVVKRALYDGSFEETWQMEGYTAKAWRAWDSRSKSWDFAWMSDNGLFQIWEGKKVNDTWYIYKNFVINEKEVLSRQAFFFPDASTLIRKSEHSSDDGKTWKLRFEEKYVKRN